MEVINNDHLPVGERYTRVKLRSDEGGNIVVTTGAATHRYKTGVAQNYAEPSCRLHDELVCWLFENAPNHVIKNDMDGITVDFYDSVEVVEEFTRAVVCLRVMGPTVLGNTWEVLQDFTRKIKDKQT